MTSKPHLVVIGNGMAGCRAVEEILARDGDAFRITIFGAEPRVNYNRIMLSPLLAGEKSFEDIVINDHAWYGDNGIDLVTGDPVVAIDRKIQTVTARSGRTESYDRLLLATGSDPFIIPVPGHDLQGVVTFRDMDDVGTMLRAASGGGDAVVIGGGLLGIEAAYGLARRGVSVTLVRATSRRFANVLRLSLHVRLENRGRVPVHSGVVTFRLAAGDAVVAPLAPPNDVIETAATISPTIVFDLPISATQAVLKTGSGDHSDTRTFDLP